MATANAIWLRVIAPFNKTYAFPDKDWVVAMKDDIWLKITNKTSNYTLTIGDVMWFIVMTSSEGSEMSERVELELKSENAIPILAENLVSNNF